MLDALYGSISGAIESRLRISDETFLIKRQRNYTYYKNFPFLMERRRNHIAYFHCIQRYATKCKARLIIKQANDGENQYTQFKEHNHTLKAGTFDIFLINLFLFFIFIVFLLHFDVFLKMNSN